VELILVQGQTYCIEILCFMFRINDILLTRCSFPATGKVSSLLPHAQFVSRAHTDLYTVGADVFPQGYSGRSVKFTIHVHLALKLRVSGSIYPFPCTLSDLQRNDFPFTSTYVIDFGIPF
jgi:hypothetical protein